MGEDYPGLTVLQNRRNWHILRYDFTDTVGVLENYSLEEINIPRLN